MKAWHRGVVGGLVVGLLTGCASHDKSDLLAFIDEVRKRPPGPIEPIPEMKPIESFVFVPGGRRDPFKAAEDEEPVTDTGLPENCRVPDRNRPKEDLERYPLDALRMVGIYQPLEGETGIWGLVTNSDGTLFRVKTGNHMGKNYGEIVGILEDKVELREMVANAKGCYEEKEASIRLSQ